MRRVQVQLLHPYPPPQSALRSHCSSLSTTPSLQMGSRQPGRQWSGRLALAAPSSHCSPFSTIPLPHDGEREELLEEELREEEMLEDDAREDTAPPEDRAEEAGSCEQEQRMHICPDGQA